MPSFRDFCDDLSLRIVEELCLCCICLISLDKHSMLRVLVPQCGVSVHCSSCLSVCLSVCPVRQQSAAQGRERQLTADC